MKMINDAMEAIHEIPRMRLIGITTISRSWRTHLAGFPASHWPGSPDLVLYFEQKN